MFYSLIYVYYLLHILKDVNTEDIVPAPKEVTISSGPLQNHAPAQMPPPPSSSCPHLLFPSSHSSLSSLTSSSPTLCSCPPSGFSSSPPSCRPTGNPQSSRPAPFYLCPRLLTFSSGYPDGVSLPSSNAPSLSLFLSVGGRSSPLPQNPNPNTRVTAG